MWRDSVTIAWPLVIKSCWYDARSSPEVNAFVRRAASQRAVLAPAPELAANLDAAYTGLALFGLAAAPVVFPQIARALGLDPDSEEFATRYAEETTRLVEHLKED